MSTFSLFLIWAALGIIIGLLARAAQLVTSSWRSYGWPKLAALALGAALLGGLLGFWLLGRLFSSATALWLAVLAVCIPGLYESLRTRLARRV